VVGGRARIMVDSSYPALDAEAIRVCLIYVSSIEEEYLSLIWNIYLFIPD